LRSCSGRALGRPRTGSSSAWWTRGAAAFFARALAGGASVSDVSRAATADAPQTDPPRPSDLLLDGLARLITEGRATAAPTLEQAVGAFAGDGTSPEAGLRWRWLAAAGAIVLWDFEGWLAIADQGLYCRCLC
jgi:hypothetical protein